MEKKSLLACIEVADSLQALRSEVYTLKKSLERFKRHFSANEIALNEVLSNLFDYSKHSIDRIDKLVEETVDVIFKR